MRYRAERRGQLPQTADAILAGAKLPAGRLITADASYASAPSTEPVLWISELAVPRLGDLWLAVAERFAQHGLWPLVLESLDDADERPWFDGEFDPAGSTNPAGHECAAVLAESWAQAIPVPTESAEAFAPLAPFGRAFPALAPATTSSPTPIDDIVHELEGRLGLVAVTRPADAPAAVGWSGPVNHEQDMGRLGAVLRSWEDRFGAYLVGLGFDTMTLAVERPPTDDALATAIAAEHFAFCPDNIWQGSGSIAAYARELVDAPAWTFWWD